MQPLLILPLALFLAGHPGKPSSGSKTRQIERPSTLQGVPPILITAKGMGPFSLGMKVGDFNKALPGLRLETSEDGEGVTFLDLMVQKVPLLSAYVGDATPGSPPTDPARTVEHLETSSPHPATPDGVRVGMRLKDVERI